MGKTSTHNASLLAIKSLFETLNTEEQFILTSMNQEQLNEELVLNETLNQLKELSFDPSESSIEIVLNYSKELSEMDTMI